MRADLLVGVPRLVEGRLHRAPALGVAAVDEDGSGGALHAEAAREVTAAGAGAQGALVLVRRQLVAAGGANEMPRHRGTLAEQRNKWHEN